jgi:prevent-host-death family protein
MERPDGAWQLQVAKARFSEVFERAMTVGPQRITRHGKRTAYLVSEHEYERLVGAADARGQTLLSFFMESPLWGSGVEIERIEGISREIDL